MAQRIEEHPGSRFQNLPFLLTPLIGREQQEQVPWAR
jgi:hypothetical protein